MHLWGLISLPKAVSHLAGIRTIYGVLRTTLYVVWDESGSTWTSLVCINENSPRPDMVQDSQLWGCDRDYPHGTYVHTISYGVRSTRWVGLPQAARFYRLFMYWWKRALEEPIGFHAQSLRLGPHATSDNFPRVACLFSGGYPRYYSINFYTHLLSFYLCIMGAPLVSWISGNLYTETLGLTMANQIESLQHKYLR